MGLTNNAGRSARPEPPHKHHAHAGAFLPTAAPSQRRRRRRRWSQCPTPPTPGARESWAGATACPTARRWAAAPGAPPSPAAPPLHAGCSQARRRRRLRSRGAGETGSPSAPLPVACMAWHPRMHACGWLRCMLPIREHSQRSPAAPRPTHTCQPIQLRHFALHTGAIEDAEQQHFAGCSGGAGGSGGGRCAAREADPLLHLQPRQPSRCRGSRSRAGGQPNQQEAWAGLRARSCRGSCPFWRELPLLRFGCCRPRQRQGTCRHPGRGALQLRLLAASTQRPAGWAYAWGARK